MIKWEWLDGWTFLHLKGGFWLLVVPLVALIIFAEYCKKDNSTGRLNDISDFIDSVEIEELPIYTFEWKIGQVLKRMEYENIDDLVKNIIYEQFN